MAWAGPLGGRTSIWELFRAEEFQKEPHRTGPNGSHRKQTLGGSVMSVKAKGSQKPGRRETLRP